MKKRSLVLLMVLVLVIAMSTMLFACNNNNAPEEEKPLTAPSITLEGIDFAKDATLSKVALPEGFSWKDGNTKIDLGVNEYLATYTKDGKSVDVKLSLEMRKSATMVAEDETMAYIEKTLLSDDYKKGGANYEFNTVDKYITILARSSKGVSAELKSAYLTRVKEVVVPATAADTNISKYTDTTVPALIALGESTIVDGVDLAVPFYTKSYVESDAFGKFAYNLNTLKNLTIPATYKTKDGVEHTSTATVDSLINFALSLANENGGWYMQEWGTDNLVLDIDATTISIIALADYYNKAEVKAVVDKAVAVVKTKIRESGSVENFGGDNPSSTAAFISGLSALGIDAMEVKHATTGKNLFDYMDTQRIKEGENKGAYTSPFDNGAPSGFSINDCSIALVSYNRYLRGDSNYFNFD